jgi:hypothetical protein
MMAMQAEPSVTADVAVGSIACAVYTASLKRLTTPFRRSAVAASS